ncbi:MAG: single-stranded DNA-binding protein [Candidatus Liptonbacteria bacterium CG11_big_fil_rev_8_21_14_0_20_35_14]|uniref:Single-stranded DNA-binding protein n=1 Tax=Candidatus Liptonbacteria bacterium CG11_big_fil_rev_8_21_14_0_20_35_14 TaxID=1974634 RepID=A0A2H0N6V3_9BACT|nr:MAG: single-stranded DNA-binding protein [Candidatus Liptonbacteria bacterium CG11_big_fil_rev_8_21_14_0_20_35_14]
MNLNKAIIIGRVTADPQVRSTPSGNPVATFSIATNRFWRDQNNQKKEEVEFHNIVVWGRQAEVAKQYLVKGSLVMIEGRIKTRSWQDAQGQTRRTTEIIAERLQLGPRPQGAGAPLSSTANNYSNSNSSASDESIDNPFNEEANMPSSKNIPTIELDDVSDSIKDEDLPF